MTLKEGQGQEWDDGSQYSQGSESSLDELAALGIANEDFKAVFIKRAMDKFSNAEVSLINKISGIV